MCLIFLQGLVGGCNLIFNPEWSASLGDMGFLSPDGRSYSFDHRAKGYSRGEGFCMVLVKNLAMAIEDGNIIRAVIRATSSNQDGRTPVICQPSSRAQEDMIRDAYIKADLDTSETRFFEAHGTGTSVGDPLEAKAINAVFGPQRCKSEPLYIGSVKSSIGHTEGASGLAGLIKTILVLEKAVIPPNALYEKPNPSIALDDWNLEVSPLEVLSRCYCLRASSFLVTPFHGQPKVSGGLLSTHLVSGARTHMLS